MAVPSYLPGSLLEAAVCPNKLVICLTAIKQKYSRTPASRARSLPLFPACLRKDRAMKCKALTLATAAFAAAVLAASGSAQAQVTTPSPYTPGYPYGNTYGFPSGGYSYKEGNPYPWVTPPARSTEEAAPDTTAGSDGAPLAGSGTAEMGKYCTTPAKTCSLRTPSLVGSACSCRVPGGRARGNVTP